MVFTSDNRVRRWATRIGLGAAFCFIALSLWSFSALANDPEEACAGCASISYGANGIPDNYVALTIDDAPMRGATKLILTALEKHNVQATFFLLGQQITKEPELVKEIADAGHEIGNHSFTHRKAVHKSENRLIWELNTTNKLIESITGHSAILYRPPFLLDMDDYEIIPEKGEFQAWDWAMKHGYQPVGADLDTLDWQLKTPEGVIANTQKLIDAKKANPEAAQRHVILLHDELHTAAALDEMLTMLEQNGFVIVPLSTVLGLSRDEVMPPVAASEPVWLAFTNAIVHTMSFLYPAFFVVFIFITLITVLRFVVFFGARMKVRTKQENVSFAGTVDVLVPAYNESENVRATLLSIINNTRIPDEILVINDGSTDDTEAIALEVAAQYPGLVKVISVKNGGKARALNIGVDALRSNVFVAIDGDTVLDKHAIETLVRPFTDVGVGATAGKIVPASTDRLIEKFQLLEYLVGQNIEKVVLSAVFAVNIVPGALGAWRRSAVMRAKSYSTDTLVEDQDLTLALLRNGAKVQYVDDSVAYTETPQSFHSLAKQRFRWTYGTWQCVYKYRANLFDERNLTLGWIALPYSAMFNVIFPLVTLVLHVAIITTFLLKLAYPSLLFLAVFTLFDVFYAAFALGYEKNMRDMWLLWYVPLQRFAYLALYSFLFVVVVVKVVDGSRTRWNKLVRHGGAQERYLRSLGMDGILAPELTTKRPVAAQG